MLIFGWTLQQFACAADWLSVRFNAADFYTAPKNGDFSLLEDIQERWYSFRALEPLEASIIVSAG